MLKLKQKIYQNSPIVIQNIMVSVYGAQLYYERFFGEYKNYLSKLLKTQWMSKNEFQDYQSIRFRNLIDDVYQNVPYYKELFDHYGYKPTYFEDLSDIKKLPILEKETIRQNSQRFLSKKINPRYTTSFTTSGTTGKSLKIYVDIESRRRQYAFQTRSQIWAGITSGKHNATFGGADNNSKVSKK